MAEEGYWERVGSTRYFTILFILVLSFLSLTIIAVYYNTLWTIHFSLLGIPPSLIFIYTDARVERKNLINNIVSLIFVIIMFLLIFFVGEELTLFPLFFFATVQYLIGLILIMTITGILGERYLKPMLISKQLTD